MPLFHKEPFVRRKPPKNVQPDDELFLCKLTGEVFADYEKFFECTIMCNSLVWTCSVTGRPGLTFQEALDSEEKARQQLDSFPKYFRRPVLYLATLTHRSRLSDMNDDLFHFYKDRYFIGEIVETVMKGERRSCKVSNIMPPEGRTLPTESKQDSSDSDDVICLDDDDEVAKKPEKIKSPKSSHNAADKLKLFGTDTSIYQYVLQDLKLDTIYIVNAQHISRKKGVVSRDKCKLFLKQHCAVSSDGIWRVKGEYAAQYSLSSARLEEFFSGPAPMFEVSEAKRKPATAASHKPSAASVPGCIDLTDEEPGMKPSSSKQKSTVGGEGKGKEKKQPGEGSSITTPKSSHSTQLSAAEKAALMAEQRRQQEEFLRIRQEITERQAQREQEKQSKLEQKEELRKKAEELRQKKIAERKEEKAKQREEKRQQEELQKVWSRPREDLECDDLKDIPLPKPVECPIPQQLFGDAIAVLEFIHCFKPLFNLELPDEITIATLLKALASYEVNEVLVELTRQLLAAIFSLQDQQTQEEMSDNMGAVEVAKEEYKDQSVRKLVKAATTTAQYPLLVYGTPLQQLELNEYTITEVLRLHLLSSGSYNRASIKFDYQQRGGYTPPDDPGLEFQLHDQSLIQQLANKSFFSLQPDEKLKILNVLIQQLLTYATCRDFLEDNFDRLRQIQKDLRTHQTNVQKRERDENFYWLKKRMELGRDVTPAYLNGCNGGQHKEEETATPGSKQKGKRKKGEPTDKDYEQMPTENLDWEKISAEERGRMKEWEMRRERELSQLMAELHHSSALYPIGRDRVFRRYWVFRSVPGLFIENDDEYVSDDYFREVLGESVDENSRTAGVTCESNPVGSAIDENSKMGVAICENSRVGGAIGEKIMAGGEVNENNKEGSADNAKEDGVKRESGGGGDGLILENDGERDKTNTSMDSNKENIEDTKSVLDNHSSSLKASDKELIKNRHCVQWFYFSNPSDLDALIDSLNSRGLREGPLRTFLTEQRKNLSDWMALCDPSALSSALLLEQKIDPRKGVKGSKAQLSKSIPAEDSLELTLRELILDLEERIYTGSLGYFKTIDREKWRSAIEEGMYDSELIGLQDGASSDIKRDTEALCKTDTACPAVRGLARALVQVEQMTEARYRGPPLGEEDGSKRGKQKGQKNGVTGQQDNKSQASSGDESDSDGETEKASAVTKQKRTTLERWRDSLLSATSLSQVFLHLSVLDSSITWSKSALYARCRICRRKGDGERMLLCDGCDRGHHMYCLKPPVKEVPQGDWFCPDCRPKEVAYTPRKQRKSFCISDNESESSNNSEAEESQESEQESEEDEVEDDTLTQNTSQSDSEMEVADDSDNEDNEDDKPHNQPAKIKFQSAKQRKKSTGAATSSKTKESSEARSSVGKSTPVDRKTSRGGSLIDSHHCSPVVELLRYKGGRSRDSSRDNSPAITGQSKRGTKRKLSSEEGSEEGSEERGEGSSNGRGGAKQGRWSLESSRPRSDNSTASGSVSKSRSRNGDSSTLKVCEDLVLELMQRDEAWPFLKPVLKKDAPDYYDIIIKPMDFSVIRNKIRHYEYSEPSALLEDIRLIFHNYKQYNMPTAPAYAAGKKLESYFDKRTRELKLNSKSLTGSSASKDAAAKNNRKRTL